MVGQGNSIARPDPQIRRAPSGTGLYDVLDLILDKGMVIDAFVRVSLVGIELLTVDARIVIASVDTYLRYAAGAERLQLYNRSQSERIPDFIEHQAKRKTATEIADKGMETADDIFGKGSRGGGRQGEQHEGEQEDEGMGGKIAKGVKNVVGRLVHKVTGEDDEDEDQGQQEQRPKPKPQRQPERQRHNGHGGKHARAGAHR